MEKFELWQLSSSHVWPRGWVSACPGCARQPRLQGGCARDRVGPKGRRSLPGICQGTFSRSCTEGASSPELKYPGHFDRSGKKLPSSMTRLDQPFSVKPLGFSWRFLPFFVCTGLCSKRKKKNNNNAKQTRGLSAISRQGPVVRVTFELPGHPAGPEGAPRPPPPQPQAPRRVGPADGAARPQPGNSNLEESTAI